MTNNTYTVVDRRARLACDCGCGQVAALASMRFFTTGGRHYYVLPDCGCRFREELKAGVQLREIVTRRKRLVERVRNAWRVYRLLARCVRHGSRKTAWRTAALYLLGQRLGLLLSEVWR